MRSQNGQGFYFIVGEIDKKNDHFFSSINFWQIISCHYPIIQIPSVRPNAKINVSLITDF